MYYTIVNDSYHLEYIISSLGNDINDRIRSIYEHRLNKGHLMVYCYTPGKRGWAWDYLSNMCVSNYIRKDIIRTSPTESIAYKVPNEILPQKSNKRKRYKNED